MTNFTVALATCKWIMGFITITTALLAAPNAQGQNPAELVAAIAACAASSGIALDGSMAKSVESLFETEDPAIDPGGNVRLEISREEYLAYFEPSQRLEAMKLYQQCVISILNQSSESKSVEIPSYGPDLGIGVTFPGNIRFVDFLSQHDRKLVYINSNISADLATRPNSETLKACGQEGWETEDVGIYNSEAMFLEPIGLPVYSGDPQVETALRNYDGGEISPELDAALDIIWSASAEDISCSDFMVVKTNKERFMSFGGTGVVNIPFSGFFVIGIAYYANNIRMFYLDEQEASAELLAKVQ